MRILYIHQYFKTPREPGGTRSYWVSQELLKRGYAVTVLTARAGQMAAREENMVDGIRVISFRVPYSQNMGIRQRLKAFTDFMIRAAKEGLRHHDVDLVIATSTPLTVGFPALRIKRKHNIPYIFEVRDLWPEVPIQMGGLKNPLLKRLAKWFEKTIYKNASHVVALSPGMLEGVRKHIPAVRTSMIPNMAKIDEFWPRDPNLELVDKFKLKRNSFKVIHFGSLGLANGAHYIIEAARMLDGDPLIEFIFLGGGSTEDELKELASEFGLDNVHFLGRHPMATTSEIVNFCDVSIVSFLDLPILYTNSPNKFFDSLSAGKPIIVNSAGWTKEIVEKEGCGYFVDPGKPEELAEKIKHLKQHPETVVEMGEKARRLAEEQYDKTILCKQYVDIIEKYQPNKRK